MEISQASTSGERETKSVSFSTEAPKESTGLLSEPTEGYHSYQMFSQKGVGSSSNSKGLVRPASQGDLYTAPGVVLTTEKFELEPMPADAEKWPKYPLRVACSHCSHFVQTNTLEETEFMGCGPCFSNNAVFRRSVNHYCPNCSEIVGAHYTGEDCFWCSDHGRHELTFSKLVSSCCEAWRS